MLCAGGSYHQAPRPHAGSRGDPCTANCPPSHPPLSPSAPARQPGPLLPEMFCPDPFFPGRGLRPPSTAVTPTRNPRHNCRPCSGGYLAVLPHPLWCRQTDFLSL
nr:transcription factor NF-E2 45 kDa subunit-like [Symphalangus syndactylus]